MHIVFIAPLPPPVTGQSLACGLLYEHLEAQGHQLSHVSMTKNTSGQGLARMREIGAALLGMRQKVKTADLIYFNVSESVAGNLKDLLIYLLNFGALDKTIIHLHGGAGMRLRFADKTSWTSRVNGFFLRRLRGVIILGERHRPTYAGLLPAEKIHSVPNFAQPFLFVDEEKVSANFANTTPLRLLYLSNFNPGKGHAELLDAFLSLPPERQAHYELNFAGGFESEEAKAAFLQKIADCPQIKYHGIVGGDLKQRLLHEAHVFFLPTYYPYEGQPISILEAYASGTVVVTTDHSGIFDTFADGKNGFAVEKRSVDSLRRVLEQLPDQTTRLAEIAQFNRREATEKYSTEQHLRNMERVLFAPATA